MNFSIETCSNLSNNESDFEETRDLVTEKCHRYSRTMIL